MPRIFKRIRPGFRYERSLEVITGAREAGLVTKSNLILGMGEEREEVSEALQAAARRGLRADHHHAVPAAVRAPPPGRALGEAAEFVELKEEAEQIGFSGVMSGPLVRSSYRAGRLFQLAMEKRGAYVAAQAV